MRYRAYRCAFSQLELERHTGMFWPMPSAWGQPGADGITMLRRLRDEGGVGALALVPILGRYAHWEKAGAVALSLEECARLGGCDQESIRRGSAAMAKLDFATTVRRHRHGKIVTVWNVKSAITSPKVGEKLHPASFRFDARVVYGGAWSMFSGTQKALYLGAASRAYTYQNPDALHDLLDDLLEASTERRDILEAFAHHRLPNTEALNLESGNVRLAVASVDELSKATGVSETALHGAINGLKWPPDASPADVRDELRYAPLGVLPARPGRPNLFLFRDHAAPWPWDVLNSRPGRMRAA
jgi:hypothetical protein